jgi:hypothetical protein
MKIEKVNHLAVFAAVLLQQGMGALWYSPILFGPGWFQAVGRNEMDLKQSGCYPYYIAFLSAYVLSYFLAWLVHLSQAKTVLLGAKISLLAWCGIAVPAVAVHYTFQGAPTGLIFIDLGHSLVVVLASGILITIWQKK